jgi:hypothetical protein
MMISGEELFEQRVKAGKVNHGFRFCDAYFKVQNPERKVKMLSTIFRNSG